MDINDSWKIVCGVIERESRSISESIKNLNKSEFFKAVKAISEAPLVVTTACGTSSMAAMKFTHLLCCIERPSRYLSPEEAVHGGLGCVHSKDVVVIISKGGMSQELTPILSIAKFRGASVIVLTENDCTALAHDADILLLFSSSKEVDNNHILATSSFSAALAILDSIICVLIDMIGFDCKKFALVHPNGAVGSKLNKDN